MSGIGSNILKLFYVLYIFMPYILFETINIQNHNRITKYIFTEYSNIHQIVEYLFEPYWSVTTSVQRNLSKQTP